MDQELSRRVDFKAYWRVIWRRKKLVLLPLVAVVGTAAVGSFFLSPLYRSSATILIEESIPLTRSLERILPAESRYATREFHAGTYQAQIRSPAYVRKVIDALELRPDSLTFASILNHTGGDSTKALDSARDQMIGGIASAISVDFLAPSIMEISVEGENADRVYRITQKVAEIFLQEALETQLQEIKSMHQFSLDQLAFYEVKLKESEEELKRFRQSMARGTIEETLVNDDNIDDANILLARFSRDYQEISGQLSSRYTHVSHLSDAFEPTEYLRSLQRELMSFSRQMPSLLILHDWTAPAVVSANNRMNSVREAIRREMENLVERRLPDVPQESKAALVEYELSKIDVEFSKTVIDGLKQLIGEYERKIVAAPTQELTLTRLEQDVETNRQIYNLLLEQSKTANLSEALEHVKVESQYRVIKPASRPLYPVKPDKAKIGVVALLIGIMMGVGLAFLSEYMDSSLKTIEDVQEWLGIPVLGTIPKMVSGGSRWKR